MKQLLHIQSKLLLSLLLSLLAVNGAWGADVEWDVQNGSSYSYSGTNNVTLKNRSFAANTWEGLCLPFSVSATTLESVFGANYNLQEFDSYENNIIKFKKATAVEAGKPYYIKITSAVSDPVFNNVTFGSSLSGWKDVTVDDNISFRGFYFKIYDYQLVNSQSEAWCFWLSGTTLQGKNSIAYSNSGRVGTQAFFFLKKGDANTTTPSISFEGTSTSGGGNAGDSGSNTGGNTGGGSSSTKTLAQKIADKDQLTDVPTLYFTISSIPEGADINTYLKKENNVAKYLSAEIQVVDKTEGGLTEFTDNVQIKVRGNSTAKEDKKPYRLKFAKDEKDAAGNVTATHKHDLLGKGYAKRNWALLANYIDPAMIRNALTYHIADAVDMPFKPGYKFADVVINGEYRGTYQITDHVEVGTNRIDIDEDTGWFLESSRGDMIEAPSWSIFSIKNPEPADEEGVTALKNQIEKWWSKVNPMFGLNGGSLDLAKFCDPLTGWRKYFDEESLVNFYVGINLTGDYDGLMTVKMYRETNGRMKFGPIWDKDLAFGNWSGTDGKLVENMQSGNYFNDYILRITKDPVFIKKVHAKLHAVLDNNYVEKMHSYINTLKSSVLQTSELNHTKWGNSYKSWNLSFNNYDDAVQQLYDYIGKRADYFVTTIDTMYTNRGGNAIVDNTIGVDYNAETGPTLNTDYSVTDMAFVENNYADYSIPALAFNNKATSALITVTGPSQIIIKKRYNQWALTNLVQVNSQNGQVVTATYLVEGDELEDALNGEIYINCNGSSNIVVTVKNNGAVTPDPTPATRKQLTDVPTIYLDTTGDITSSWNDATTNTVTLTIYDSANKLNQGAEYTTTAVQVQYQGSGAAGSKNSYRLKFGSKTRLLASGKYKQWVLASNDDDPSMINNALTKELGDALGMPFTPGYQFVDLYVNNEYQGTYQVTDRIKAESGRALVSGGNKDNDWHIQFNAPSEIKENDNSVYVAATENTPYIVIKNPDPDDLTAEETAALKQEVADWFLGTNDGVNYYDFEKDCTDNDQLFSWYIGMEILCSYKGLSSVEAYRSVTTTATDQTLHMGPFWDSEKAFGNAPKHPIDMTDLETEGSYEGLITEYSDYKVMRKWLKKLWMQNWFAEGVVEKWETLYGSRKTTDLQAVLKTKAAAIAATLTQTQAKNAEKWTNSLGSYTSYSDAVNAISTYLDERFPYLDAKFKELKELAQASSCDVNADNECNMDDVNALAGKIIKTYKGKFSKPAADLNEDGIINIIDLTKIIGNLISHRSKGLTP